MLVALKLIRTEIPILKIIITKNRIELEGDKLVGCFHGGLSLMAGGQGLFPGYCQSLTSAWLLS